MKKLILAVAVTISSGTIPINSTTAYWAVFGPIDVSTQSVLASTTTPPIIIKSATTADCYQLTVQPNGTLGTKWVTCQ